MAEDRMICMWLTFGFQILGHVLTTNGSLGLNLVECSYGRFII